MQVVYPRCCGLDIHKKSLVACVLLTDPDGTLHRFVRTFGTMTTDLLGLDDWLSSHGVTHVAMESTGVLWRPVFNVLEEGRTLLLVNAQHIKALPGHKTDVKDSQVARGSAAAWATEAQLYPTTADTRSARSDPLSQIARGAADARDQSHPQGAGGTGQGTLA